MIVLEYCWPLLGASYSLLELLASLESFVVQECLVVFY